MELWFWLALSCLVLLYPTYNIISLSLCYKSDYFVRVYFIIFLKFVRMVSNDKFQLSPSWRQRQRHMSLLHISSLVRRASLLYTYTDHTIRHIQHTTQINTHWWAINWMRTEHNNKQTICREWKKNARLNAKDGNKKSAMKSS